jgi:DNA-binding MarR family transcriptional regulator
MRHYATHREKTQRAIQAYMDLIDTAEWLKGELRAPLESFDLTMGEFRLLDLLHREGALTVSDAARRRKAKRQNMKAMIKHLEGRGWVRREIVALPPVGFAESHRAKSKRGEERDGRQMGVVGLTGSGKKFIRDVLPSHSKLVRSLMCVLDSREQLALSRTCRKLRAGDVLKFLKEIRMEDEEG